MKKFFKSLTVAFSMYSKIPMPRFQWDSKDMENHLCFFPWVGAVIGLLEYLWCSVYMGEIPFFKEALQIKISQPFFIVISLALPLLVTGGFHVDGFMDTMDAVHSYGSREKKLEILKDPHIGAFSVISLVIFLLLATGGISEIIAFAFERKTITVISFSFFISRCLSGISVIFFPTAKKDGMAAAESRTAGKRVNGFFLFIQLAVSLFLLFFLTWPVFVYGVFCTVSMGLSFLYFAILSRKTFGGITGDLCGFFVCVSELSALLSVAVCAAVF